MKTIKSFVKKHHRVLRIIFYGLMLIAIFYAVRSELSGISRKDLHELTGRYSPLTLLGISFLGLLAFSATGLYDCVIARYRSIQSSNLKIMVIGWIAQAFNNFVGFGGMTGGTLRKNFYIHAGVKKEDAVKISLNIWLANLLGLFMLILISFPEAIKVHELHTLIIPLLLCLYIPIYFLGGKVKIGSFDGATTLLGNISLKQKADMLFVSTIDWICAATLFYFTIHLYQPGASLFLSLFIYSIATVIGILSFIPAALGSFDLTCVFLFSQAGFDKPEILMSILIYRLAYYLIPWLFALTYLFATWSYQKWNKLTVQKRASISVSFLSIGVFFCGALLIFSVLTPEIFQRIHLLNHLIPEPMQYISKTTTFFIGVMLVILSHGIKAKIKRIHHVCIALLFAGATGCLLKGLDYEEATILVIFAVFLIATEKYFSKDTIAITLKNVLSAFLLAFCVPVFFLVLENHTKQSVIQAEHWYLQTEHLIFYGVFVFAISMIILFSESRKVEFKAVTDEDEENFESLFEKFKGNEYTHLFYLKDKNIFFNEGKDVMMLYRPVHEHILVLSDPVGNRVHFEAAVDEMVTWAKGYDMDVSFYEISSENLEFFCNQGFSFLKIGENATVSLLDFSLEGNKSKKFRYMKHVMEKNNQIFEVLLPPFDQPLMSELREISEEWLDGREEMGFSLGFFEPDYLNRAPIAIMKRESCIDAFASLMPDNGGKTISVDLMRFHKEAPPGTMDGLFISLFEWGKQEGYEAFNLGMAPMSNVGNKVYSHGFDKLLSYIYDFGNKVYNFKGLRRYKEKFHPVWNNKYIVYKNNRILPGVLLSLLTAIRRNSNKTGH